MKRFFSTGIQKLTNFLWKGTEAVPAYETTVKEKLAKNPKLVNADTVEFHGAPHTSVQDPQQHVSGVILKQGKRLTSFHAREDGTMQYSKEDYNKAQEE